MDKPKLVENNNNPRGGRRWQVDFSTNGYIWAKHYHRFKFMAYRHIKTLTRLGYRTRLWDYGKE